MSSAVSRPPAADSARALKHFENLLEFVVYCAGPHCNGTEKAAIRLAKLERPVKKMIGGVTGWLDEGFNLIK
jgi:rhodanese-related sulfurtransferase